MTNQETFCNLCNHMELNHSDYVKHLASINHKRHISPDTVLPEFFTCELCDFHTLDESHLRKHKNTKLHLNKITPSKDLTPQLKYRQRKQEEAKREKVEGIKWMIENGHIGSVVCKYCDFTGSSQTDINRHNTTSKHKRNVDLSRTALQPATKYCDVCDITSTSVVGYIKHCSTMKHKKQVFMKDNITTKNGKLYCIPCSTIFTSKRMCNDHLLQEHRCKSSEGECVVETPETVREYTEKEARIIEYYKIKDHYDKVCCCLLTYRNLMKKRGDLNEDETKEYEKYKDLLPDAKAEKTNYEKDYPEVLDDDTFDIYISLQPLTNDE